MFLHPCRSFIGTFFRLEVKHFMYRDRPLNTVSGMGVSVVYQRSLRVYLIYSTSGRTPLSGTATKWSKPPVATRHAQ